MKRVKVFHISKNGEFVFKHEAIQVKDKDQARIKEWIEARGRRKRVKKWSQQVCVPDYSRQRDGHFGCEFSRKQGLRSHGDDKGFLLLNPLDNESIVLGTILILTTSRSRNSCALLSR